MPIQYYIFLSFALFSVGIIGVLVRRNAIIVFMCIELMLNAVNLLLVAFSKMHHAKAIATNAASTAGAVNVNASSASIDAPTQSFDSGGGGGGTSSATTAVRTHRYKKLAIQLHSPSQTLRRLEASAPPLSPATRT